MITLRGSPVRRPVVVSRKVPHFPGRGRHSPLRPPVIRTIRRCTCQAVTTNHRGGRRAFPPAMPTPFLSEDLTIIRAAVEGARVTNSHGDESISFYDTMSQYGLLALGPRRRGATRGSLVIRRTMAINQADP